MKRVIAVIGAVLVVVIAAGFVVYRFKNPELTETQLFIIGWPFVLLAAVGLTLFKTLYK